jgi:hypothetical protein
MFTSQMLKTLFKIGKLNEFSDVAPTTNTLFKTNYKTLLKTQIISQKKKKKLNFFLKKKWYSGVWPLWWPPTSLGILAVATGASPQWQHRHCSATIFEDLFIFIKIFLKLYFTKHFQTFTKPIFNFSHMWPPQNQFSNFTFFKILLKILRNRP